MEPFLADPSLLVLPALGVICLLLLFVLFRKPPAPVRDPELVDDLTRARAEVDGLRAELAQERVALARLGAELEAARAALDGAKEAHAEGLARIEAAHEAQLRKLDGDLASLRGTVETQRQENAEVQLAKVGLQKALEAQEAKHRDLIAEIESSRAQYVNQFKAISAELLQNQGRVTTEAQKAELEKILSPFKVELGHLHTGVKEMTERADKERQTLGAQILIMQEKAVKLSEEANSLTQALRGDTKRQGNWGETILERILEAAGLVEGTHYTKQASVTAEDGRRMIPDIVVHLPGNRDVVIDAKVTLVAYQDMVQAGDDRLAEEAALKRHLAALKAHMTSLSRKSYGDLGFDSVDSVLMFLPVEGALSAALAAEPDLVIQAAEKRIHLMTPSTLMPTLKIVEHLWTIDTRNRNVDDIVDRAGKLHDKFVAVVESIDDIGRHLKKASESQAEAVKRMSEGAGNVLRQVDSLRTLGAKSRKSLPTDLLELSDEE